MNNITELVFILDRSGSMHGLESDTIGGFNSLIDKQKRGAGCALVTTVLFDTSVERVHDRIDIQNVPLMTAKDYIPGGCTALLDAIGSTIKHIVNIHRYARKEDIPEKTVFVITTDGLENASHHYCFDLLQYCYFRAEKGDSRQGENTLLYHTYSRLCYCGTDACKGVCTGT